MFLIPGKIVLQGLMKGEEYSIEQSWEIGDSMPSRFHLKTVPPCALVGTFP